MIDDEDQDPDAPLDPSEVPMVGPKFLPVEPNYARSQIHPDKRGVVTIREIKDLVYERQITYPDRSFELTRFGDWRELMKRPKLEPSDKVGGDAAARRFAEIVAGKALYCHPRRRGAYGTARCGSATATRRCSG